MNGDGGRGGWVSKRKWVKVRKGIKASNASGRDNLMNNSSSSSSSRKLESKVRECKSGSNEMGGNTKNELGMREKRKKEEETCEACKARQALSARRVCEWV